MSDDPAKFPFPASDRIRVLRPNEQPLACKMFGTNIPTELDDKSFISCGPAESEDGYVCVTISYPGEGKSQRMNVKKADLESKTAAVRALKITQDIRSNSSNQVYFKSGDVVELLVETLGFRDSGRVDVKAHEKRRILGFLLAKFELGAKSEPLFELPPGMTPTPQGGIFGTDSDTYPFPENDTIRLLSPGKPTVPCYAIKYSDISQTYECTKLRPTSDGFVSIGNSSFISMPQGRDSHPVRDDTFPKFTTAVIQNSDREPVMCFVEISRVEKTTSAAHEVRATRE
eukprot:15097_1